MSAENQNVEQRSPLGSPTGAEHSPEHSLDTLARSLASGTISRGRALWLVGGACPTGCPHGQYCCPTTTARGGKPTSGTCIPVTQTCSSAGCPNAGEVRCGGACVSVLTDVNNCGTCGHACDATVGEVCVNGTCQCPPGWTILEGVCSCFRYDSVYGFVNLCPPGQHCQGQGSSSDNLSFTRCPAGTCCAERLGNEAITCATRAEGSVTSECMCVRTSEGSTSCLEAEPLPCHPVVEGASYTCTTSTECPAGTVCGAGYCRTPCGGEDPCQVCRDVGLLPNQNYCPS